MPRPKGRAIITSGHLFGAGCDFADSVRQNADHREVTLKLWLAAAEKEPIAPDMGKRELATALLNPRRAFEIADVIAGGVGRYREDG